MPEIEQELKLLAEHNIKCVVIGGVAARAHGSSHETLDLDVCYARDDENLTKLAAALLSVHAKLRGAPKDISFRLDAETLRKDLNFTFETDLGAIDLLGEVRGIGGFTECFDGSVHIKMFCSIFYLLSLEKLIVAKRTAGRMKDLAMLPELEAILEYENVVRQSAAATTEDDNED